MFEPEEVVMGNFTIGSVDRWAQNIYFRIVLAKLQYSPPSTTWCVPEKKVLKYV